MILANTLWDENNNDNIKEPLTGTDIQKEIVRGVLRQKLSRMRHLVISKVISTKYLDTLFPKILNLFHPQTVQYNGGIAKKKKWNISCYIEVMEGGVPCTDPNHRLRSVCLPLLNVCNNLFVQWYEQQHVCKNSTISVKRLMTFITRYTASSGEQSLLKHIDGAGKVDGSLIVSLPMDKWSAPEYVNSFDGYGGGLTLWDGNGSNRNYNEVYYKTRSGDVAFIDRAVWHQG